MKRRFVNLLTALLLLLCVAACVAWGRGYWRADALQYARVGFQGPWMTTEAYHVTSARGGLTLSWGYTQNNFSTTAAADEVRARSGPTDNRFRFQASTLPWLQYGGGSYQQSGSRLRAGFGFRSVDSAWPPAAPSVIQRGRQVVLPWPVVVLLFGALPGWQLWQSIRRARLRRRIAAGVCLSCGYDLRGTPDRCPECGRSPAARVANA